MGEAKREYEFLYILGLRGAIRILYYLNDHDKSRYKDLKVLKISVHTQNSRLSQLLQLKLISHHLIFEERKKIEWYEITEKGKKILEILEKLEKVIEK